MKSSTLAPSLAFAAAALGPPCGAATCGSWDPGFSPYAGTSGPISALVSFDDGSGAAIFAAGSFTFAGDIVAHGIARWNGTAWHPLASGMDAEVLALTAFDDGLGPALYASGKFTTAGGVIVNGVARWDGTAWSDLGGGLSGHDSLTSGTALAVFDDGSGSPALYVGGFFTSAGGVPALNVARWDGHVWSPLGGGVSSASYPPVASFALFDDGRGPALFAAGAFTLAGAVPVHGIARWDGAWSDVGGGVIRFADATVLSLVPFDDGRGPSLVAGGRFSSTGGVAADNIARWNGSAWSPLGAGTNGDVKSLIAFDDGSGRALWAGGSFSIAGGARSGGTSRWDGTGWSAAGTSISGAANAFTVLGDGSRGSPPVLYAAGGFGGSVSNVVRWTGADWAPLGHSLDGPIDALAAADLGSGPALYAAGEFTLAPDGVAASTVARFDGTSWSAIGGGLRLEPLQRPRVIKSFDLGSGRDLYVGGGLMSAGGAPQTLLRFDGIGWSGLGSGPPLEVFALALFDDGAGPALYAGGANATGGSGLLRWDGSEWRIVSSGITGTVEALAVFDDGSGPALFAGGEFTTASGAPGDRLVRWDGRAFSAAMGGMDDTVETLSVWDDGAGKALYAGGRFTVAGGVAAHHVAKWDGRVFTPLGAGIGHRFTHIYAMQGFDSGTGPALYAAGDFAPGNVQRWDGLRWSPVDGGVDLEVSSLAVFDDGTLTALYAGGLFGSSGGVAALRLARFGDPCAISSRGNVNAGAGAITDVLFVNDSPGGRERRLTVATHDPLRVFMAAPPASSGPAPFALYAWLGEPDASTVSLLPRGLGLSSFPMPLSGGTAPLATWNNTGRRALGEPSVPSQPAPGEVLRLRRGTRRRVTFFLQGLVFDPGSRAPEPASVTNGVTVESR